MDVLNAMRVFIQVADAGNFTRAAEQLDASLPTITRVISQLEAHLNVRLFQRTTRRISLTDAGTTYLEGCLRAVELIDETESQVVSLNKDLRGRLRVVAGSSTAFSHMVPVVSDFVRQYPAIRIDFFTMDNVFSLVDEGVDVAILADYLIPSDSVVARRLITHSYVMVAAPRYLSGAASLSKPLDLKRLCFLGRPADQRGTTLRLRETGKDEDDVIELTPNVVCNNAKVLQELTLSGCGFSILPRQFVQQAISDGTLVRLLPDYRLQNSDVDICVVYQSRKRNSRIASVFVEHVLSALGSPVKYVQES
ncbi:LysR family transcriptional regulator [Paraburkholderia solisilvae]|uniref:HTH-type transcriptional regulator DmlR n=1 Tax=Paraburkholderia solisilvae TaxID=624376 RepID=A0A6J5DM25_9BURK|nr:LysR family transcriptional regulator [Paraburkholderia solisilvae]CAB3755350.1 HTH-type transcriptional regulator DmlR [Paraburkholderia solisilvae]